MASCKRRRIHEDSFDGPTIPGDVTLSQKPPNFLTTFDRNFSYPSYRKLCDLLPISSIIALTRTCKQLNSFYRDMLSSQWDINKRLRRFVKDPNGLRSQMGEHDALISGSFALQFFERVTWDASDLDIFIPAGPGAESFGKHLQEAEGYSPQGTQNREDRDYDLYWIVEVREISPLTSETTDIGRTAGPRFHEDIRGKGHKDSNRDYTHSAYPLYSKHLL